MNDYDNAAVWGRSKVARGCFAKFSRGFIDIGRLDDEGTPMWLMGVREAVARGLCTVIADHFRIELHPPGTAAKLEDARTELFIAREANAYLRFKVAELETSLGEERQVADTLRAENTEMRRQLASEGSG